MRDWNLKLGDPLALTLATDARAGLIDYCNDQIWELSIGQGEPPALALQTTYGLRARSARLFPRFSEDDASLTDPAEFARGPVIHQITPSYLQLNFAPFVDIDVDAEYWVPESHSVAGRLKLRNSGTTPRQITMEWVAQLLPNQGVRMATTEIQSAPVLVGESDGLAPVVFMTGGLQPGTGSYPALALTVELPPGEERTLTWSHAALNQVEASFSLARQVAARSWEAEIARLQLLNAGQVELYTGDPDWDIAFALTKRQAFASLISSSTNLADTSFVLNRLPDQGFSLRGDGSDYNHLWNGQTPLETYHLANILLPSGSRLAQGMLRNFLSGQAADGFIDWKPGLAGQRSRLLATPILTSLAWSIFQSGGERAFLEEAFPKLLSFVQAWFTARQDRDGDGIPEWDHAMQSGFDDHPVFSPWHTGSQGVDITTAESPTLCAFLYREIQSLVQIARVLERSEPLPALLSLGDHLRTAIESAWDETQASYHYWDRDTHHSPPGERLGERTGPGRLYLDRFFDSPVRLLIQIQTSSEATRRPLVIVYGTSAKGQNRVERISYEGFQWHFGTGILTGERVYARIDEIDIQGIEASDQVIISSAGYCCDDHTLFLPLWAGIPAPERAERLVRETLTNPARYWRPYGIPACPNSTDSGLNPCNSVHLPWNTLIGEGLLAYGYRDEAAELVTRLMAAIIPTLKQERAFRRFYHADTGQGSGERNAISGLAPLSLFLDALGVRIISPRKVALQGYNPFPWPVTVKYRGLTLLRQKDITTVIFPDGQTVIVDDPTPRIVSLEKVALPLSA